MFSHDVVQSGTNQSSQQMQSLQIVIKSFYEDMNAFLTVFLTWHEFVVLFFPPERLCGKLFKILKLSLLPTKIKNANNNNKIIFSLCNLGLSVGTCTCF